MSDSDEPHAANSIPVHNTSQLVRMGVRATSSEYIIALAGNPNTGKSTVFNALTGLHQHTGNWPGKTVTRAEGGFIYRGRRYKLVDLPGTYSLLATSNDEEIARDFVLFGQPDVTVVVADATRLERNLNLVLQVMEITERVVIAVNLVDEAGRHGMTLDTESLSGHLAVPVVPMAARQGKGIERLLAVIDEVATGALTCQPWRAPHRSHELATAVSELEVMLQQAVPRLPNKPWVATRLLDGDRRIAQAVRSGELLELAQCGSSPSSLTSTAPTPHQSGGNVNDVLAKAESLRWKLGPYVHQSLVEETYATAAEIADTVVQRDAQQRTDWDRKLDKLLTNWWTGGPIMVGLLAIVLWLTVAGANVPSAWLATVLLDTVHPMLKSASAAIGLPLWLDGVLIDGCYLATAWVVSVMLPPMAIFFPLFTLLEDFGYLPRVAFNLDHMFRRCGAHGKQALTMCMGFGCNAAGVIAARVIDSPRERLIAILTNNFSLCNGRWPTQILIATIFIGALVPGYLSNTIATAAVVAIALLGLAMTFLVSWVLSRSMLRGEPSAFHLELPPFRPPRFLRTLYTSLIDRTVYVLWRAVLFALPAGALIWTIANVDVGDRSLAEWLIASLDPVGLLIGLNGVILVAYIVAIPANEIVVPTVLMLTVLTAQTNGLELGEGRGVMFELDSTMATGQLLRTGGWTVLTGINLMLFSLLHNPCSTTIYTIYKETQSWKWTLVATLLPIVMGISLCFVIAQVWYLVSG